MANLVEAYDCLVVGDEPAAYWWIDKVITYTKAFPRDGKKTYSVPRIAHLSLRTENIVPLPLSIAKRFGIRVGKPEEVECLLPDRLFSWNEQTLEESFHFKLPKSFSDGFQPSPTHSELSALKFHLAQHPELLDIARGLWRIFGRADELLPEYALWNALQLTAFSFWQPTFSDKERQVRHCTHKDLPPSNWLRTNSQGAFELELLSGSSFSAPLLILAVNARELTGLRNQCTDLLKYLPPATEFFGPRSLFSLELKGMSPALLTQMKPFSIYFEHFPIPMPEEVHSLRAHPETGALTIDFLEKSDFSLDAASVAARKAYEQVLRLLPDLKNSKHSIGLPLDTDTCLTDEQREVAIRTYQHFRQPRYSQSLTHSRTLHPRVQIFTPFLNCHLPYPYGQLALAKSHLKEYFGNRRYKKSSQSVETPAFFG